MTAKWIDIKIKFKFGSISGDIFDLGHEEVKRSFATVEVKGKCCCVSESD